LGNAQLEADSIAAKLERAMVSSEEIIAQVAFGRV